MNPLIVSHFGTLKLNTRLFINCLDGVGDATAQQSPGDCTNNMTFLALHLLDARSFLARYLGVGYHHPYEDSLREVTSVEEMGEYPPLDDVRTAWRDVSDHLTKRFPELRDVELIERSPQDFPVDDGTVLGGIAFLLGHESFHIGQLAFLRRYFGLGAMSYQN
jgi:hypothetical protein